MSAYRLWVGILILVCAACQTDAGERPNRIDAARAYAGVLHPSCKGDQHARASQTIRIHTELMMASLACGDAYQDPDLFERYRSFTSTNAAPLEDAERVWIDNLGSGASHATGDDALNAWRTEIANDQAAILADQSTGRYCQANRTRFDHLIDADPSRLNAYVIGITDRWRSSVRC